MSNQHRRKKLLDLGGSTTFMMAQFLKGKKLTALTNSFRLAKRLLETTDIGVSLTAGTVDRRLDLVLSPFTSDISPHHYASRTFMGVAAIAPRGPMEVEPAVVQARNRLMGLSDELIVLADSTKFSRRASLILCALNRVNSVITDTGAPDGAVRMLEHAGVNVILVEPERDFSSLH
jgi:DeoR family ulaG and ulaABCDEF operon transcriptional repressor